MLVSILHRATGTGLAIVGVGLFTWWLAAVASGARAYENFTGFATSWIGIALFVGLSWAFWFKTLAGLRHLVMDIGAGFELNANKRWAVIVLAGSFLLTIATWAYIVGVRA